MRTASPRFNGAFEARETPATKPAKPNHQWRCLPLCTIFGCATMNPSFSSSLLRLSRRLLLSGGAAAESLTKGILTLIFYPDSKQFTIIPIIPKAYQT